MHEHCEEIVQSLKRDNATLREALEGAKKFGDIQLAEKRALLEALERLRGRYVTLDDLATARAAIARAKGKK